MLYLDLSMGAAGDMLAAALLGLLPDPAGFVEKLNGLGLPGVQFTLEKSVKCGIAGLHLAVAVHGQAEGHPHDHHHDHHADEVFTSWGCETIHTYTKEQISGILEQLESDGSYGNVLRAKGMVAGEDGEWIYFDMVPEEHEVRAGAPEYTGRICVIGAELNEDALAGLFGLS